MFRVTSVSCFLLVIVLLNLAALTDACHLEGALCENDADCCLLECCLWRCASNCEKRGRRQALMALFGQR
nr:conotoxin precursor I2 [Conus ebraeus]UMA83075.1 conotoxin precursor I2 [Conus judaeus]UMA83402.1 conotoxin precursor I2 [Conus judaeus]DAZ86415.1 TPA_inf: conotoxin precursor I2 [Conus judaeus]